MARLLLVEDDARISEPLRAALAGEGFAVDAVTTGEDALDAIGAAPPDLVLLDLTLPGIDGLEVCRRLRAGHPTLPVVMLTARAEEIDVVVGLGTGADDYVTKPFRVAELVARIRARLRAAGGEPSTAPELLEAGELRIDVGARRAVDASAELDLTPKEFDLLALLVREAGRTVRRERIMREVWDEHWWGPTRTLDNHVSSLRRKLGDHADEPQRIVTVRGVGFRFER
ncbi:MAG TPA: response regulator transcription factor [Acidimicrobiales bacterium]|nr:response regulator transcription factor [Acidimicrobiales bacterium]